jgi:hypothetical protein
MIPNYLRLSVVRRPAYIDYPDLYSENVTEIIKNLTDFVSENTAETFFMIDTTTDKHFKKMCFVIIVLCFKILPVLIIIVFSVLLILNICRARQLSEHLHHHYSSVSSSTSSLKRELRTTTIIVLITLTTVIAEFLQSLFLITIEFDPAFAFHPVTRKDKATSSLAYIRDIASISSSFITFIIYCLMSEQFRMEVYRLLIPKCFKKNFNLKRNTHLLIDGISLKRRGTITHKALMSSMEIPIPEDL